MAENIINKKESVATKINELNDHTKKRRHTPAKTYYSNEV